MVKRHFFHFATLNLLSFLFFLFISAKVFTQDFSPIKLSWLGNNNPDTSIGLSWGVPFNSNEVSVNDSFILKTSDGRTLPVQTWPMAYWPNGSIKWAGLSTVTTNDQSSEYKLVKNTSVAHLLNHQKVVVKKDDNLYTINTGNMECSILKGSTNLISVLKINDTVISENGKLICVMQNGPNADFGQQPEKIKYESTLKNVTVEQEGPLRAVLKLEGIHRTDNSEKECLPFVVRLYFYAGQSTIKMVHSIVFDGNEQTDFIRGIAVEFELPMNEELHNRHVRFAGKNNGLWNEPVKPLTGRQRFIQDQKNLYEEQLKGLPIANKAFFDKQKQFLIDNWASWNDFKLVQSNSNGFAIQKRTNNQSAWIDAGSGDRSDGMVFLGDISGGMGICVRDFWQSYPSMLEIRDACSERAKIRAWLWSPDSPPMDMRHYDTLKWGHNLDASYEDIQPGFSTPYGVGRTSELVLFFATKVPSNNTLNHFTNITNNPPLLRVSSEYLHSVPVFGMWSLPDTSTKGNLWIEKQLNNAFEYYKIEVEQRNWYGFWDYGDIMHSYDRVRHTWRYDIGGFAWDNTELMPNLWLWYSFLRSGREDIFRMAEAMTRHTSEVDVYHAGRFKGLGSRHNVRHWGCGAKEVRISQSALNRFYYYLTTDERTGDLMHEVTEASNTAIGNLDPVRLIMEKSEYPTHARIGPDWFALVGNWMTEWERTGDTIYRNKILTGIDNLSKMPYGLFSGKKAALGYNPMTNEIHQIDSTDIGYLHLMILMGGPEVIFELNKILESPDLSRMWLQFCKLYGASPPEIRKELGVETKLGDTKEWAARLPAYYYSKTNDKTYAEKAWSQLLDLSGWMNEFSFEMKEYRGIDVLNPVYEIPYISTNYTAQWCLNAIQVLELAGKEIPKNHYRFDNKPAPQKRRKEKQRK